MKIAFLTSYSVSHIIPIKGLIQYFLKNGHSVICFIHSNNIEYCENNGIPYIAYPHSYWEKKHHELVKEKNEKFEKYNREKNFMKLYDAFLEKDAIGIFNYHSSVANFIEMRLEQYNPNIVFRDSTDIYWMKLKEKEKFNNIKTIGYITNNLYSWDYLMSNYDTILPIFLGIINFLPFVTKKYLREFKENIQEIYKRISLELDEDYIRPFYQYDPDEKYNVIFSQEILQPKLPNKKNIIIYPPSKNDFVIEKNISSDIVELCKDNNIIYISTGSFMSREIEYYRDILKTILENFSKYKIIISGGKATELIQNLIIEMKLNEKVLAKKFIPQKYVLMHCKFFITSGGLNSIKESIFFNTPMIVFPISSEQRLNALIIENLKLGFSMYHLPDPIEYFKKNIVTIFNTDYSKEFEKLRLEINDSESIIKQILTKLELDNI